MLSTTTCSSAFAQAPVFPKIESKPELLRKTVDGETFACLTLPEAKKVSQLYIQYVFLYDAYGVHGKLATLSDASLELYRVAAQERKELIELQQHELSELKKENAKLQRRDILGKSLPWALGAVALAFVAGLIVR